MREQIFYTSIASGGTLSGVVGIKGASFVGLMIPSITSAQVGLAVAQDSGAAFMRAFKTDGTSHFIISAGPGSAGVSLGDVVRGFSAMKIETLVGQADTRSFTVIIKY